MREIKLRAWDKYEKEMVDWEQYKPELVARDFDNEELVVMQYTGRKDKNGKEIYEGDVVDVIFYNYLRGVGIVKFDNSYGQWGVHMPKDNYIDNLYEWVEYGCKVIGNIYENPNLLEVF